MPNHNGQTTVVHCRKEPYDVYIGRPGKWGNPFSHLPNTLAQFRVTTRDESITRFKAWILASPNLLKDIKELKGKVLGCWCKPKSCHGDVLAELANESH
jgi:hypothetical protein